jgi:hypothetical protein
MAILCATDVTWIANAGMLSQYGDSNVSPVIWWERSMRSIYRATEEIAELRRIAAGEAPSVHREPMSVRRVPSRSQSISVAMSWLVTFIIDGFAAYAEAMCPCVVDTDEDTDLQSGTPDTHSRHEKPSDRLVPRPLSSRPDSNEHEAQSSPLTASGSRDRGAFRLARLVWGKRLGRANRVPAVSPEMLDDRMLHDIGLHREEVESFARQTDPWGW